MHTYSIVGLHFDVTKAFMAILRYWMYTVRLQGEFSFGM
jgi:hypothetical protein